MAKPRTLANTVSDGGPLADGAIAVADVTGLQTALDAKASSASLATVATSGAYADLSGKPSINSLLPSQTGNSGKYLTTDGTNPSWATLTVPGNGGVTSTNSVTLTSASAGAQSITTTKPGLYVKLPDATTMSKNATAFNIRANGPHALKVMNSAGSILGFIPAFSSSLIGLADNSTAAGSWVVSGAVPSAVTAHIFTSSIGTSQNIIQKITLDADRSLILTGASGQNTYGVVFDQSTGTFGSFTLIRAAGGDAVGVLHSTDKVLVANVLSGVGQTLYVVCLTISGTTITVNTSASTTNTGTTPYPAFGGVQTKANTFVMCGSTAVLAAGPQYLYGITLSGTTVTIGAAVTLPNMSTTTNTYFMGVFAIDSSRVFAISGSTGATSVNGTPYSVSGTTLTVGTSASVAITASSANAFRYGTVSNGARWYVSYIQSGTNVDVSIFSVAGTVASVSTARAFSGVQNQSSFGTGFLFDNYAIGNKIILCHLDSTATTVNYNIVTDTSGTASAGTKYSTSTGGSLSAIGLVTYDASNVAIGVTNFTDTYYLFVSSYTGSSPGTPSLWVANRVNTSTTVSFGAVNMSEWNGGLRAASVRSTDFANSFSTPQSMQSSIWVNMAWPTTTPLANFVGAAQSGSWAVAGNTNESWGMTNYISSSNFVIQRFECVA